MPPIFFHYSAIGFSSFAYNVLPSHTFSLISLCRALLQPANSLAFQQSRDIRKTPARWNDWPFGRMRLRSSGIMGALTVEMA